jgi:hypothetical protein
LVARETEQGELPMANPDPAALERVPPLAGLSDDERGEIQHEMPDVAARLQQLVESHAARTPPAQEPQ